MTQSSLLDKHGEPYPIAKSFTAPNLDPDFWLPGGNDPNATVKNATSMPYAYNVWVYKCVSVIAQNVSQLSKHLLEKRTRTTIEEHGILTLLEKPNSLMTQVSFLRMILCNLLLPATRGGVTSGGQCFIIPWNTIADEKVRLDKGEIPNELFPYSEIFFTPWTDSSKDGRMQPKGWKFEIPNLSGSAIYFEHGEIIRINQLDPYDMLSGISPFSPIASAVELDAKSDVFNTDIFANSGRLDGQVTTDQFVDATELQQLKEEWYKQYTGERRKRVAFLAGGLKFEQYALSSVDLQYIEQGKWSRQKILGAYGLNRIGVGDYEDINFATIREGRKMLWYDTYIPTDKLLLDAFNFQWITNVEDGKYLLSSDYTKVPALQADMQDRARTGGLLVKEMGYPPSLASRIVELPLKEEDIIKWPHLDQKLEAPSPFASVGMSTGGRGTVTKDAAKRDYSTEYIDKVLDPGEKVFRKSLDRYFIDQRNRMLDKVDAWASKQKSASAAITKSDVSVGGWEFLPDLLRENLELLKVYKPSVKTQIGLEKSQVESEFGRGIQWDAGDTRVQYWTSARSVYLESINTSTFEVARDVIDMTIKQGLDGGLTVTEMAKEVKRAVHDVYEVRQGKPIVPNGSFDLGGMSSSLTIARTEMGTIASMTRNDIFREEGIEHIEWVTSMDDRVRPDHAAINEAKIKYGDTFPVVGLRFPRDPNGSAGQVINCRCAFIAVLPGE